MGTERRWDLARPGLGVDIASLKMRCEGVVEEALLCRLVQLDLESLDEGDTTFQDQRQLGPVHQHQVRERCCLRNHLCSESRNGQEESARALDLCLHLARERAE